MRTPVEIRVGDTVRAFHPQTLGVVKYGEVLRVGRKHADIDFGLTGRTVVRRTDVLEVTER